MKKAVGAIVCVLAAAWLQTAWFGHLRPLGVMPDVMLIVVVLYGLWSDATPALAVAVGGGLLLDLASGSDFGLHMAFFVVVALVAIAARQLGVQAGSVVTAAVAVVAGTILYDVVILATFQASVNGVVVSRVARELLDNLMLLALVCVVRANLHSRPQAATLRERRLHR